MVKRPNEKDSAKEPKDGESPALYEWASKFKNGHCWARHGPLIYKAKILKTERKKNELHLFVHYLKWNAKWDTWVSADEALSDIPETEEEAKRLQAIVKKAKENKHKRKSPVDAEGEESSKDQPSKKEKTSEADPTVELEEEEEAGKGQKVCLKIPGQIKKELINDWETITKNKRLVALPRPAGTVSVILSDFQKSKAKSSAETSEQCEEMCNAIKVYFDRSLPFVLLYNQEREQYKALTEEKKVVVPSDLYGAEHLSRLFVKFPELLSHTQLTTPELGLLQPRLADFLKWFAKNPKYFGKQYIPAPELSEDKGEDEALA